MTAAYSSASQSVKDAQEPQLKKERGATSYSVEMEELQTVAPQHPQATCEPLIQGRSNTRWIAWGILFVFCDLKLGGFDVFIDCLGWLFIALGLNNLCAPGFPSRRWTWAKLIATCMAGATVSLSLTGLFLPQSVLLTAWGRLLDWAPVAAQVAILWLLASLFWALLDADGHPDQARDVYRKLMRLLIAFIALVSLTQVATVSLNSLFAIAFLIIFVVLIVGVIRSLMRVPAGPEPFRVRYRLGEMLALMLGLGIGLYGITNPDPPRWVFANDAATNSGLEPWDGETTWKRVNFSGEPDLEQTLDLRAEAQTTGGHVLGVWHLRMKLGVAGDHALPVRAGLKDLSQVNDRRHEFQSHVYLGHKAGGTTLEIRTGVVNWSQPRRQLVSWQPQGTSGIRIVMGGQRAPKDTQPAPELGCTLHLSHPALPDGKARDRSRLDISFMQTSSNSAEVIWDLQITSPDDPALAREWRSGSQGMSGVQPAPSPPAGRQVAP